MKKVIFISLFMLVAVTLPVTGQSPAPAHLVQLLPPSDVAPDWKWLEPPTSYTPDDLFEYINGNADLYLAYDFVELVSVEFVNEDLALVIDIYNMGNPLNAFGIYSTYRSPESDYAEIGSEAMVSDYYIRFLQDKYVVDLNLNDTTPDLSKFARKMAQEISRRIGGKTQFPEILQYLPPENLVDKSPKYISEGLLGYRFLPKGLEAQYQIADFRVKAFIALMSDSSATETAFVALQEKLEAQKKLPAHPGFFTGKLPYHQFAIFSKKGKFIWGVIDLPAPADGLKLMQALSARIQDKLVLQPE